MEWFSTKFLVFSGTAVSGGGAVAGWAIYNALKEDVETTRRVMNEEAQFWNGKIDVLEQELINLNKKGNQEDNKLIEKIVGDVSSSSYFNLKNDREGFVNKEKTAAKRKALADFCRDNSKHLGLEVELITKLCGR